MEKTYLKIDKNGECHIYSGKEHLLKDEECYISYCKNLVGKTFELRPYIVSKYKELAQINTNENIYVYNTLTEKLTAYKADEIHKKEEDGIIYIMIETSYSAEFDLQVHYGESYARDEYKDQCIIFADYEEACEYAIKKLNEKKDDLQDQIHDIEYRIKSLKK